jgi:hypothetical protein
MNLKRHGSRSLFAVAALCLFAASAQAYNVTNVTIQKIHSPNVHGHLYVVISGVSNCPDNPQAYFIIPGWLETTEPGLTYRKTMLALILSAHASGKTITVNGAQCYLNRYLLADELVINE